MVMRYQKQSRQSRPLPLPSCQPLLPNWTPTMSMACPFQSLKLIPTSGKKSIRRPPQSLTRTKKTWLVRTSSFFISVRPVLKTRLKPPMSFPTFEPNRTPLPCSSSSRACVAPMTWRCRVLWTRWHPTSTYSHTTSAMESIITNTIKDSVLPSRLSKSMVESVLSGSPQHFLPTRLKNKLLPGLSRMPQIPPMLSTWPQSNCVAKNFRVR
jgi:hypothetical protein